MVQKEKRQGGGKRAWTEGDIRWCRRRRDRVRRGRRAWTEGDIRWCRRRKDREGARGHGLRVT